MNTAILIPGIEVKTILIYDTNDIDTINKIFDIAHVLIKKNNKYYYEVAMIKNKNIDPSINVIKMMSEQNIVYILIGNESTLQKTNIDHILYLSENNLIIHSTSTNADTYFPIMSA